MTSKDLLEEMAALKAQGLGPEAASPALQLFVAWRKALSWERDRDTLAMARALEGRPVPPKKTTCRGARSCSRCHGSGYLEQYKHVARGVCFACNGKGRKS